METIHFNGQPCHTYGTLPGPGEKAPCFTLVRDDLTEIHCSDFRGRPLVLNIFPSLDTPVCAASVRRFNIEAAGMADTAVLCVSMDLPFAAQRFCASLGTRDVIMGSAFRSPMFAQKYGLQIVDGPLAGLLARSVMVLDRDRRVVYSHIVEEITHEPPYEEVLEALKGIK